KFVIPAMLLSMGLAFLFLSFTNSVVLVMLSVCMVGFGQGSLFPIITLKALDKVDVHQGARVVALTSRCTFLGQFLSPLVLGGVATLATSTSLRFKYGSLSVLVLMSVVISTIGLMRSKQQVSSSS